MNISGFLMSTLLSINLFSIKEPPKLIKEIDVGECMEITYVKKENRPLTFVLPGREIVIWHKVKVTFYTNSVADCGNTRGIGASGLKLNRGHAAMPKSIPFGTKMYIEGIGIVENQDTGSAVKILPDGTLLVDIYIPNANRKDLLKMGTIYTKGKFLINSYDIN